MGRAHQDYLNRQILHKEEILNGVESDLKAAQTTEQKQALDFRARELTREIDSLFDELKEDERRSDFLVAEGINPSVDNTRKVERRWAEYLHHVNHHQAKRITDDILMKLQFEPGDSLFVFQDANDFLGERYIKYLDSQLKNSKIGCCSPPCQIGFLKSQPNSLEFLAEFARRFEVERIPSQDLSAEVVLDGIQGVLEGCTIFFVEVNLSDFDENCEFIDWFVHQFWKPLLDRVDRIRQKNPPFVCIGAVTLDSELEEEFWDRMRASISDCPDKFVVFEREVWEKDEIRNWMTRYSGIPLPNDEHERVVQSVQQYQKGIPSRAEEKLRKELERLAG